jgi:hypothetical protein
VVTSTPSDKWHRPGGRTCDGGSGSVAAAAAATAAATAAAASTSSSSTAAAAAAAVAAGGPRWECEVAAGAVCGGRGRCGGGKCGKSSGEKGAYGVSPG